MKKALLLTFLALFTSTVLVGCGKNSSNEQSETTDQTTTVEQQESSEESSTENSPTDDTSEPESKEDESTDKSESSSVDLGEKPAEGESVEGDIYGNGKYRITKTSDSVIVEWGHDLSKNVTTYKFENDKLSGLDIEIIYNTEEDAKSTYDELCKDDTTSKSVKDIKLDGKKLTYSIVEEQFQGLKNYTKDGLFEECKKQYEELSKVDDIRSDD